MGRSVNALEETKQLSNTLIIFTGDHGGYFWGEHGLEEASLMKNRFAFQLLVRDSSRQAQQAISFALSIDIARRCSNSPNDQVSKKRTCKGVPRPFVQRRQKIGRESN